MAVHLERNHLRPGERYLEYFVALDEGLPMADARLREIVFDLASGEAVHEDVFAPDHPLILRRLDLRALDVARARMRLELAVGGRRQAVAEAHMHVQSAEPAPAAGQRIPVALDLPGGVDAVQAWPVTFGVPFPAGSLWDLEALRVVDREGVEVPFQADISALWSPSGSVRWVRFDVLADSERGLAIEAGKPGVAARPSLPVTVARREGLVEVDTGAARYTLEGGGALVRELQSQGRRVSTSAGRGLYVVDQHGRTATAAVEDALIEVESAGPVAASVRIEGVYRTPEEEELARHITRFEFFAGRAETRVIHTLVLTRDTNDIWFHEIGWEIPVSPGSGPRALFNTAALEAGQFVEKPFEAGVPSFYLFQSEGTRLTLHPHPRLGRWIVSGQGEYAFVLGTGGPDGDPRVLHQGERMGNWMALAGDEGGLFMACRDAARQHPKDFEIFPDRMVLRLFSPRGGDALDFRSTALVERWGLARLEAETLDPEILATVAAHDSNAAGWSRTHELTIAPLPARDPEQTAARLGRLQHDEVFAHADPAWIHRSGAMGPLHPRDPGRFPEAERMIEFYMRVYGTQQAPGNVYHGFVDYFTGPHYAHPQRWYQVYDTLTGYWTVYARSGDRAYRRTAQGATRSYFDGRIAHWDAPGKTRGLMTRNRGPSFTGMSNFPYYWGQATHVDWGNSTDLQRVLWDYYLTGYRRSRDIVRRYGEGLLRFWRPELHVFSPRPVIRLLYQAYELDWDPRLRVLAEATATQRLFDPAGDLFSSKRQPYGCTLYKTEYDMDIPVEIWQLTGSRRYYEMARALAEHHWRSRGIAGRQSGLGIHFLYHRDRSPAIAADLAHFLRKQAGNSYQPDQESYIGVTWSQLARYLRGIPYAMDVVAASGADHRPPAAMLDFGTGEGPAGVFLRTDADRAADLVVRTPWPGRPGVVDSGIRLAPHAYHARHPRMGQWLNQAVDTSSGYVRVRIPYDSVAGAYELRLTRPGAYTVIADCRRPLVVSPAGAWQPAYTRPATRFYFDVPAGAEAAAIRFENGALLYAPDGTPWNEGQPVQGWQELPDGPPGLWGFELVAPGEVEGRNFPSYYAMGDPEFHFVPEISEPFISNSETPER